ncbi:MAG: hypothetical protein QHH75_03505 [Bacillota bacterium]|nr:hypothetical protein [Bacillota bacterium]
MAASKKEEFFVIRRIPERGAIFDLFRQVTEKILSSRRTTAASEPR